MNILFIYFAFSMYIYIFGYNIYYIFKELNIIKYKYIYRCHYDTRPRHISYFFNFIFIK